MIEKRRSLAPHWTSTPIARLLGPMQEFINHSAAGGIVLMVATVIALLLANGPFAAQYDAVLHVPVGITVGPFALEETLLHWINDGLMAIFFFLVGLEIKREVTVGELATPRAAALPIIAAIGGALTPALIYRLLNANGPGAAGWGVPMATDIAFALGCLALLGERVPFALKVFLTAVAIVDDLIAVLVIAVFYSGALAWGALGIAFGLLALLMLLNRLGIRTILVYAGLGVVIWLLFLRSGVHATIAGVLIALTIPARSRIDAPTFVQRAQGILQHLERQPTAPTPVLTDEMYQSAVLDLEDVCEQVQAPLQKMEHQLHGWVQFAIMPTFALANAGVTLELGGLAGPTLPVLLGIVLGLTIGKPLGILGVTWLAVRTGLVVLPQAVTWQHMIGVAVLAGIGFTMSLFIAALAFADPDVLATAKLAILVASVLAGLTGSLLLRRAPSPGA